MKKVLIIDNNLSSDELGDFLIDKGYCPYIVDDFNKGLEKIAESTSLEVVLLSAALSAGSGQNELKKIKEDYPNVIVIVIRAGVHIVREAIALGALEVLLRPINYEELCEALDRAFDRLSNRSNASGNCKKKEIEEQSPLVGKSKLMVQVNKQIGRAVSFKASVLLTGETGTGKGVVARLIHTLSDRKNAPFIALDCGAIPEALFEDALFGHVKGAYTDAKDERSGAFERADGGTLFLDEVSNMTPAQQGTLLTVLQEREFQRVGSNRTRSVDVRVISATNKNLKKMMEEEKFRKDLYYRLCDYEISVPPLRDRKEDISLLTTHFLQLIEKENKRQTIALSPEAEALLETYNWPGNVRELYSCLKRAAINSRGHAILSRDLPEGLQMVSGDGDSRGSVPKTPEKPIYQNLLDLPIAVFCKFISKVTLDDVTEKQISLWWEEFSNDGRDRAYKAKREIEDLWKQYYTTTELDVPGLREEIKKVIDKAISKFSKLRHRIDSELIEEAEPVCIKGKSHKDSFTEILREIVKEYNGNKQKAAKELRTTLETLETRLLYRTEADKVVKKDSAKGDGNDKKKSEPTLRKIERFPIDEIMRLHTEPIKDFILENLSRAEWRNKELEGQIRTVHLALKVLSKRLGGKHGYIYFGGLIFPRIEWNIYRRAPYLYADIATATKVLDVTPTTFKKYWDENKLFPSRHTLFTG